jgi:transcription-repair coupling factor (superfamily II helicase)
VSALLAPLVGLWKAAPPPAPSGRWAVPAGARAFAVAGLAAGAAAPLLVITPREREADELGDDLGLFLEDVAVLPAWETLPFEHLSPNVATMARRAKARHTLATGSGGTVVVASVRAVIQRLSPSDPSPIVLQVGEDRDVTELSDSLTVLGYERTDRVESRGEYAVRGGILDVFPADAEEPIRLDFWGDTVEDIRVFAIGDQRSQDRVERADIFPAREFRADAAVASAADRLVASDPWNASVWERIAQYQQFTGMESWMPWLAPESTLLDEARHVAVVVVDPTRAVDRARDLRKEEDDLAAALAPTWGHGAPQAGDHPALFLDFEARVTDRDHLQMPAIAAGPGDHVLAAQGFDATPGDVESVSAGLERLLSRQVTPVIAMDGEPAADRVARVLADQGVVIGRAETLEAVTPAIVAVGVHRGFVLPELGVAVLGEQEIAGRRRAHRRVGPRRGAHVGAEYRDLVPGDYVVHHKPRHRPLRRDGQPDDGGRGAGLHGGGLCRPRPSVCPHRPTRRSQEVHGGRCPESVEDGWQGVGGDPIAGAAGGGGGGERGRASASGTRCRGGSAYGPDSPWQREMEGMFPFEETPDQLTAITDVKVDMETDRPMDRLMFGDVGFGKTEMALRAAFKAALSRRAGRCALSDDASRQSALPDLLRAVRAVSGRGGDALALPHAQGDEGRHRQAGDR